MKNFYFNNCIQSSYYEDIIIENCSISDKILNNIQISNDLNISFEKVSYSQNGLYLAGLSENKIYIYYNKKYYNKYIELNTIETNTLKSIQIANNGAILLIFTNNTINVYNYSFVTNNILNNLFNDTINSPLNILTAKLNNNGNHLLVTTSNINNKNSLYEISNTSIQLIPNSLDVLYKNFKNIIYSNTSSLVGLVGGDNNSNNELRVLVNKSGNSYIEIDNDFEEINYKSNLNFAIDNSNFSYIDNNNKIKWYILTSSSTGYNRTNYEIDLSTDNLTPTKLISLNNNKILILTSTKLLVYNIVSNQINKLISLDITFSENNGIMYDINNQFIYISNNSNEIYRFKISDNTLNLLSTNLTTYENYLNFNKEKLINLNNDLYNKISTNNGLFYYIENGNINYLEYNLISTTIYYNNEIIDSEAYSIVNNTTVIKKEWLRENFPIDYSEIVRRYEDFTIRKNIINDSITTEFINFRDILINIQIVDYNDLLYFNENNIYTFAGAIILDTENTQTYTLNGVFGNNSIKKENNTVTCSFDKTTNKYKFNYTVYSKNIIDNYSYQTISLVKYDKEALLNDSDYSKSDLNCYYENLNNNLIDRIFTDQTKEIDTYEKDDTSLFNLDPYKITYNLELDKDEAENSIFYLISGHHITSSLSNGLTSKGTLTSDEEAISRFKVISSFTRNNNLLEDTQEIEHELLDINSKYVVPTFQFSKESYATNDKITPSREIYDSGISLKIIAMHNKVKTKRIHGYNYIDYINEISEYLKESYDYNTEINKDLEVPHNYITMDKDTFPITGEVNNIQINNSGSDIYTNTKLNTNDFLLMNGHYIIKTQVENDYIPTIRYILRDAITFKSLESTEEFEIKKRILPPSDVPYTINKTLVKKDNNVVTKYTYIFEKVFNQNIEFYSGISLNELGSEFTLIENDNNYTLSCETVGKHNFLLRTYLVGLYNNFNDNEFNFEVEENELLDFNSPIEITNNNHNNLYENIKYNNCIVNLKKDSFNKIDPLTYNKKILYKGYIHNSGWTTWEYDGAILGTVGQSLKLRDFAVKLNNQDYSGGITYRCNVEGKGWTSWKKDGNIIDPGNNGGFYGIRMYLTGEMANYFSIYYQCHIENVGWLDWKKDDEIVDYGSKKYFLEAIKIRLIPKNEDIKTSSYPNNSILELKYTNFNGINRDIFYDRDMPLYLFNNTSINISEKSDYDTSKIFTESLLKNMSNTKPDYTYTLDDIDYYTIPPTPIINLSSLSAENILMESPVKKVLKNAIITFNNLNSTDYTSIVYINGIKTNIEKNNIILQSPGTYNITVCFISNLNYLGNKNSIEFEIIDSDQIPPFIEYSNITDSTVDVNIRYLLSDTENDSIYDNKKINGTFTYPSNITTLLQNYPPMFMQEILKTNSIPQTLLDLNSANQQVVTMNSSGNYSFTMNSNDRLIARRRFMNNQTGEGTIDIETYVFNDVPDKPEISVQVSSKDASIVYPIVKKELGCLYEITVNGESYTEGTPLTVSGQVKKDFIIKAIVKYKENTTLTNSNTLKFTIDTIQPLSPIIKIGDKTIKSNKIYNISKDNFKPIISNKEDGVIYTLNIEGYVYDITNDNYTLTDFKNNYNNFNRPFRMVIYSQKESNKIQIHDSYYIELNNNPTTDNYYTKENPRNIVIPYLEENDIYEYPGELVINPRTGDFSLVSNDENITNPELGYKLNRITFNIKDEQPNYLLERNNNYLIGHQEKLEYYKKILTNLQSNNTILANLLGKVTEKNRSTGNIETTLDDDLLTEISNLNTKYTIAYTNILTNKLYTLNSINMTYSEAIEYFKTVKKQSSNINNLIHISNDNSTTLLKEKLLSTLDSYYDLVSLYSQCKYNLINLDKETNKKILKSDFELFKNRQETYYNNMKNYLSKW